MSRKKGGTTATLYYYYYYGKGKVGQVDNASFVCFLRPLCRKIECSVNFWLSVLAFKKLLD
ncbi:hypothetical protein MTBBW1_2290006 [Desulfamplus magnetovallimortis]|uniref:Uncharacterized protein n=1 Tax=Desulfamplus magnetovallimortis TaxID=1246637 RepID=A0A1W1HDK3_9BACT|nr:hypothetical protein MTBBW1_2290006 [Desulfamplus magnetovallimortis]